MSDRDLLIIDINGLGYAAMYQPNLARLEHDGFQTGGIHGALASVFMRMAEMPLALPVVIWDGHARWRKEMYPEYKSNRKNDPGKIAIRESYIRQTPYIQLILNRLGIPQLRCETAEADDLAGSLCRNLDASWKIELDSKDTDYWQALAENVDWYSPSSGKKITLATLADPALASKDGHFLNPREYLQAKALAGDASDCISGIEGVGLKTATKIMRAHGGTTESFWDAMDAGKTPKGVVETRMNEKPSREIYQRNLKLMDWSLAPEIDTGMLSFTAGRPDWDDVQSLTEQFGLSRTLSKAKEVMGKNGRDWGHGLDAVESALYPNLCQPIKKKQ